jgi:tRNA A-37 threonylcarbamoyl transferase component Bud32
LIAYDESKLALTIKRVGDSCKGMKRGLSRSIMEGLGERLRNDTRIHHGDIAPVNVCYSDGEYYLIDFEKSKDGMGDIVCSPSTCRCYKYKK